MAMYILLIGNILADSYFTVENIEIKLDFDTDRDIRNLAIEEAQTKAIIELSEKLSIEPLIIFSVIINLFSKFSFLMPRARTPSDRLFKDANN